MTQRRKKAPPVRQSYHHNDLRRALLDAALTYLADHEITKLNLQVLARAAGVSAGAPYHHFADKEALIAALATEGFELMNARFAAVEWRPLSAAQALELLTHGYLDFASEQRAHYRLMFLPEWSDRARFPELHQAAGAALSQLVELIGAGLGHERQHHAYARAMSVFALLHGIAELNAAKVLTSVPGAPDLATQRALWVERVRVLAYAEG